MILVWKKKQSLPSEDLDKQQNQSFKKYILGHKKSVLFGKDHVDFKQGLCQQFDFNFDRLEKLVDLGLNLECINFESAHVYRIKIRTCTSKQK